MPVWRCANSSVSRLVSCPEPEESSAPKTGSIKTQTLTCFHASSEGQNHRECFSSPPAGKIQGMVPIGGRPLARGLPPNYHTWHAKFERQSSELDKDGYSRIAGKNKAFVHGSSLIFVANTKIRGLLSRHLRTVIRSPVVNSGIVDGLPGRIYT